MMSGIKLYANRREDVALTFFNMGLEKFCMLMKYLRIANQMGVGQYLLISDKLGIK